MKYKIAIIIYRIFNFIEKMYWYSKDKYQKQLFCSIGRNVDIAQFCHFTYKNISIGNDVSIGLGCHFSSTSSMIYIGDHVMFGPNVSIHGGNHRFNIIGKYMKDITLEEKEAKDDENVYIENDIWVGDGVIILKGVRIGRGSIIGANCVITTDIAPYSIVTGSKPFQIRPRWNDNEIKKH